MKTLKLSQVDTFKIRNAYNDTTSILRDIKRNKLEGKALGDMQILETAVQHLECFLLGK